MTINQSNFYNTNIPGVSWLSGATARSVFKSKVDEAIPGHQQAGVYGGIKSKRYVLRRLLKVATKVAEWTDSGRLFQREGVQDLNALAPALVWILRNDRVILCLISANMMEDMWQVRSEDKEVALHEEPYRSANRF